MKDLNTVDKGDATEATVIDRDKYRVGMADKRGNTTRLRTGTSGIPSKHSKGGQSAQRWERYRSEKKKTYVR